MLNFKDFSDFEKEMLADSVKAIITSLLVIFLYTGSLLSNVALFIVRFDIVLVSMKIIFYFLGLFDEENNN